ncbi:Phage terminase, small subunit [plant metagenome]
MREGRHTLDELIADVQERFPNTNAPSRSALGRYRLGIEEMAGRMRDIEAGASALVGELGEGMGDRAGALLAQAVTTLAANAALEAHSSEKQVTIEEISKLARAAKAAMEARTMSMRERQAIERAAREKLLAEQEANLKEAAQAQGMDADQVEFWRKKVLGIA